MPASVGKWRNVRELIEFFVLNGCVLEVLPGHLEGPEGTSGAIRYLYSPHTDDFASLSDLDDGDFVPQGTYENWQRRLGIDLPD